VLWDPTIVDYSGSPGFFSRGQNNQNERRGQVNVTFTPCSVGPGFETRFEASGSLRFF